MDNLAHMFGFWEAFRLRVVEVERKIGYIRLAITFRTLISNQHHIPSVTLSKYGGFIQTWTFGRFA